jgi:hypothetical protein
MSVNVILSLELGAVINFPKLMISNEGLVVLFLNQEYGTIIKCNNLDWKIGESNRCWEEFDFIDYQGEVTLKNE